MKVLIIGASGMLAKPVIKHFDKQGFQLRLFSRTVDSKMFNKPFEIVNGDIFNPLDLEKAIDGCDAIHINISKVDEEKATKAIVDIAKKKNIKLISIITGCTVLPENRWFELIDKKYKAEQIIINSGIPYLIFRPTWFFESLDLMVRDGKAFLMGKQLNPYHWVAAEDYASQLVNAYQKDVVRNKAFYVFGPEEYVMKDLLEKYCKNRFPEIKKVSSIPIWMIKIIAILSGNKELQNAVSMFAYFEKVKEAGNANETNNLLGKPQTTFNKWLEIQN